MNFLKRLFSSKKNTKKDTPKKQPTINNHQNESTSNTRYTEETVDPSILNGTLKLIESYFIDNKIERKIEAPVNHPINLDQIVEDGMGFQMYCKAFNMEDKMIIASLSMAFSEFMIQNFNFKKFTDNQPEYPLRFITLIYSKNDAVLSLYPFEYSLKVLNYEATFEDILKKVQNGLENLSTDNDPIH